jgi:REP element-mobilizing transposase RayT
MPRKARLDIPGLLQHVIARGIERRKIFIDDKDRSLFVDRLSKLLEETETDCFAWALIPNHFHLLIRCNKIELSRFMRRLLTGYAINFNHRHNRAGHLFQNRYKSIVSDIDSYLYELVRYIHLNPIRARLVPDIISLNSYPWSGHAVLMGKKELPGQTVEELLFFFGGQLLSARKKYQQFVSDGVEFGKRPELVGGGLRRSKQISGDENIESYDERILGKGDFVEKLQRQEILRDKLPVEMSIVELQEHISSYFDIAPETLLRRSRNNAASEARAVFCYLAVQLTGQTGTEVGQILAIGPSSVSRAIQRGKAICQNHSTLENLRKWP